jgi:hypothetical protein
MTIKEHYQLGNPPWFSKLGSSRAFITGCEYEIESIIDFGKVADSRAIRIVEDHSLRNGGREFTTAPMLFADQVSMFGFLHSQLKLGEEPFSDRTSIHVHVNVRELTLNEVRQFVLLYALLEPLFFKYVGDVRKGSIFCVPLNWTYLPSLYKLPLPELRNKWHKYTALNISPISTFGTVEFRHMYGTNDIERFRFWLGCLKELYEFVESSTNFDIIRLLTEKDAPSSFDIAKMVVPSLVTDSEEFVNEFLDDTLLDVKLSAGGLK